MLIRPVADADWSTFYPVFREVVAAGETYAYPEGLSSSEAHDLWVESPPGVTVVAVSDDGTLLGSAKAGPNRPSRGSHVATASFMVADAARGQGVGRALGEWVLAWAREQGYAAMQFNAVVETNTAAVRLVARPRLRGGRHRAGGLRLGDARPGRAARHAPVPLIGRRVALDCLSRAPA